MSVLAKAGAAGLTGRQKAAVFLITIGTQRAAGILKHLSEREIEALSAEMASLWRVNSDTAESVVNELADRFEVAAALEKVHGLPGRMAKRAHADRIQGGRIDGRCNLCNVHRPP